MAVVLVVDDESAIRDVLDDALRRAGHEPALAETGPEALRLAAMRPPALALVDLKLTNENGLEVFRALREQHASLLGVVVTGHSSVDNAFASGQAGIVAFIQKPIRPRDIVKTVDEILQRQSASPVSAAGAELASHAHGAVEDGFEGMIGASPAMQTLFREIDQAARLTAPVLITGETGTGKELVARAIHRRSARRAGPFVAVNCAAMPGPLFEAEFFGHERGVFTGADVAREGWFETASGGVLFLDEVGEMPLDLQAKLLRTIDQRQVTRLGARRSRTTDVRLLAATNVDLEGAVAGGTFRSDLYWRLNAFSLRVPPVRERGDDVLLLVEHVLRQLRVEVNRPRAVLASDLRSILKAHRWPGNVREIQHRLRRALLQSQTDEVGSEGLEPTGTAGRSDLPGHPLRPGTTLKAAVAEVTHRVEAQMIAAAMDACSGHLGRAARLLGVDERTLYTKLRRHRT